MSAAPLPVPAEAGSGRSGLRGRAVLALVPAPVRARRAPFVALLLVLLAAGLVGLLLLNTASAQDAFRLHTLQGQAAALAQQQQELASSTDGLDDPARLASRAAALGLGPGGPPVFLAPGQPLPAGAIRLGNLAYIPAPVPVTPVPAVTTPAATATQPPAAKPVTKKPVTKKPVTKKPATQKPVSKKPVTKKPATKKSAKKAVATTPATRVPARTSASPKKTAGRTPTTTTTGTSPGARTPVQQAPAGTVRSPAQPKTGGG